MSAPKLDRLQGESISLSRLQDNMQKALSQVPASAQAEAAAAIAAQPAATGIAAGKFSTVVMTAQTQVVAQPLGKKITGMVVVNKTQQEDVWISPSQPTGIDQTKQIQLQTSVSPTPSAPISFGVWWF